MNRNFLLWCVALFITVCCPLGCKSQGVDLARMQGWDIVVAGDAILSEVYAAEEFQGLFAQATGINLPIVNTSDRADRHVFIGPGEAMRSSAVGFDVGEFGPEDLRIVARDGSIAIAGGRPRGTLYGVYTFLEDYLGVRFLAPDHTYAPKVGASRRIDPVERFYHPPLTLRWSYYRQNRFNHPFATRLRNNALSDDPKLGGKTTMRVTGHSFYDQIPSTKYGKEHPEYYSEVNGVRLSQVKYDGYDNEPCLTNPDVLRIVTKAVLKKLDENPELRNVAVSQNDNNKYCRCAKCRALDEREGTPMGSLLTFVNAVADEVAKKHPDVTVGTLSYWYSRKPPKTIKPRPNVQIQLCSIECCLIHAIDDPNCSQNVTFCRDMRNWAKICDNISIWNYNTNFSNFMLPCPNLRSIGPNVQYFVKNNAKGVFMQAANYTMGELSDLRNYMISNMLWDPTRNGQELMDEFLELHYGPAAGPIRGFINLVHDNADKKGIHRNCFGEGKDYGIDEAIARAGLKAFAEAMTLADTDELRSRVEKASICAYSAAVEPAWYLKKKEDLSPELAARMRPLLKRFFILCERYKVDYFFEGTKHKREDTHSRIKVVFGLKESEDF